MKNIIITSTLLISIWGYAQNFKVEEKKVTTELIGDLYDSPNKETVVMIIAGSGPTDRNGNTLGVAQNNSLKLLAEGLYNNGFDVFTYDKRVVYLIKNEKEISPFGFQHGIDDAKTVAAYLKNTLGYKHVVIAGHSEGSLIGMLISGTNIDGYISIAGSGRAIDEILKEQINKQAPMLNEESNRILAQLKQDKMVKDVAPMLQMLYGEQNQPFLMEWMKWNPQTEIAKIKTPVLILNGTKDLQVTEKEAALLHKAQPASEMVIINNMNHVLKNIEKDADNLPSYNNPDLPVHPELTTSIVAFLKKYKL